jgi:glutamate-1-semialdehyde 2,1-aminomutase
MSNLNVRKSNIAGYSQLLSKRFDQFSYDYWPSFFHKAKGTDILCDDQNWYKDMSISGIGACLFGYADERIDEAVIRTIKDGVASSLNSKLENEVASLLLEFIPGHEYVRYAKSGGEAMSIAVRIARANKNKSKVLFSGYHGWSDWYLAANLETKKNLNNHLITNLDPLGVPMELKGTAIPFIYGDILDLEKKILQNKNEIACIVMEPARSQEANKDYLQKIVECSERNNILLIFDEISSGFRQTKGPYAKEFGVLPDIYVFAKSIGNGYPIAAITGKKSIMKTFENSFVSSTNWTEATGLAAAKRVLEIFRDESPEVKIATLGNYWEKIVNDVAKKNNFDLKTSGLPGMKYLQNPKEADLFRTFFTVFGLKRKFLVAGRYYPNTAQSKSDINEYGNLLDSAINNFQGMNKKDQHIFAGKILPGGFNALGQIND